MSIDEKPAEKIPEPLKPSKSKKNKIIISAIMGSIPVIFAILYVVNPTIIDHDKTIDDFPLHLLSEGYDMLCIPDACLVINSGKMMYEFKNGLHIFRSTDGTLIKHYGTVSGHEENSMAYSYQGDKFKLTRFIHAFKDTESAIPFWLLQSNGK